MQNKSSLTDYDFYIYFPAGYENRVSNIRQGIIDFYYVRKDDMQNVYIGTLYSIQILNKIFLNGELFVAEQNMIIVKDLDKETIYEAINLMYNEGYLYTIISKAGIYEDLFTTSSVRNDLL